MAEACAEVTLAIMPNGLVVLTTQHRACVLALLRNGMIAARSLWAKTSWRSCSSSPSDESTRGLGKN